MFCRKDLLKSLEIHIETPVLEPLPNNVTRLQAIRFETFLKRDSGTGVSELTVRRCSTKLLNKSQNSQENKCFGVSFQDFSLQLF